MEVWDVPGEVIVVKVKTSEALELGQGFKVDCSGKSHVREFKINDGGAAAAVDAVPRSLGLAWGRGIGGGDPAVVQGSSVGEGFLELEQGFLLGQGNQEARGEEEEEEEEQEAAANSDHCRDGTTMRAAVAGHRRRKRGGGGGEGGGV